MSTYNHTIACARELDGADELAGFRARFHIPSHTIYLDGNSLGLLSQDAESAVLAAVDTWRNRGVDGWLHGDNDWFSLAAKAAALSAPLMGAEPDEVIVGNSTTINIHQLLATLFQPAGARNQILVDGLAFPTDRYAVHSHLKLRGLNPEGCLRVVEPPDGIRLEEDVIVGAMTEEVQLALLPAVVYTTGQLLDMPRLTTEAHRRGILIGFDCSHSAGVLQHALTEWGVDFAVWCGYKYLNGGPGATSGLYLNRRHFGKGPGLAGWFSSEKGKQFDMSPKLSPAGDASALQIGTPPILSLAPLIGSLPMIAEAGIERLRSKSLAMTEFLMSLIDEELRGFGFSLANPRDPARRGGHVALLHSKAAAICAALKDVGVVPDYRPPNIVRLAPAPLYNSFGDCHGAISRLKEIMTTERWREIPVSRGMEA